MATAKKHKALLLNGRTLDVKLLYNLEHVYIVHDIESRKIKLLSKTFVESMQPVK